MLQPEPSDNLGFNVCKLCAEKIYAFYEFRLSYLESEKKLREMLHNYENNQRLMASGSGSDSASSLSTDEDSAQPNLQNQSDQADVFDSLECRECGRRFERELELRIHLHTHRETDTPSQNNDSHNGFDDQYLIANIKSEPVEYDLDPTDWADTTQSDADNSSLMNDDELRWKCTICQQRFLRRAHLRAHRREHATDRPDKSGEKRFIKDERKATIPQAKHDKQQPIILKKKINFNVNLNVTADAQFDRWQCKKCLAAFRTRRLLRDHNVVHRNTSMASLDFDNSFLNSTNDPNEPFIHFDADSEAAVASAIAAASSIDEQTSFPPTEETTSPKSASTPMKSHDARWKCPKCRKAFDTPKALRKHKLANHTFEIKLNLKSKNFVSEKKSVSFSDLTSSSSKKRKLEARSQFVERDWPCNSCHQVFNRRSMLREHRRTVHMLKPTGAVSTSLKQEQIDDFVADEYAVAD